MRRLTRFLVTLLPIFLLTEKPIFGFLSRFFAYTSESSRPPHVFPARYVYRNSFFRRRESMCLTLPLPYKIKLEMQTCGKQMPAASACAFVFCSENTEWLRAQNFAAFGASAFDDVAAVGRLHTFAESVHFAPLTFFRLIGPYHSNPPLS